jgi:hypothetical protein
MCNASWPTITRKWKRRSLPNLFLAYPIPLSVLGFNIGFLKQRKEGIDGHD